MPATYTPIATTTLSSNQTSVTFSSLGSYTDIIIISNAQMTTNNDALRAQFNSDTGTNYSITQLYGDGTNAASNRQTGQTAVRISNGQPNSGSYGTAISHIMNFSNSTTYKTIISRAGAAPTGSLTAALVGLWRSTAAITSITLLPESGGNILAGSSITIYGIKSA